MISIIAVIGKSRELGKDNKLLWHIPGDLPRFKRITWGHPIIVGRKSHTTFQYNGGPLPGRTNIVITHEQSYQKEGFVIIHSLDDAIDVAKKSPGNEEMFVIGGGQIYAQAIDKTDRLYLTVVDAAADADTFFPDYSGFTNIIEKQEQNAGNFRVTYLTLEH